MKLQWIPLADLKVAWRVMGLLFTYGFAHASEGRRAIEGYVRGHFPSEDVGDW